MPNTRIEKLNEALDQIEKKFDKKVAKRLYIEKHKRLIARLDSFSADCAECEALLEDVEMKVLQLAEEPELSRSALSYYQRIFADSRYHLRNKHKVVEEGYYFSFYPSFGVILGVILGEVVFDHLSLGVAVGIGLGVAVGASLDANAKKKGLVI